MSTGVALSSLESQGSLARERIAALSRIKQQLEDDKAQYVQASKLREEFMKLGKQSKDLDKARSDLTAAHAALDDELSAIASFSAADSAEFLDMENKLAEAVEALKVKEKESTQVRQRLSDIGSILSSYSFRFPEFSLLPGLDLLAALPASIKRRSCVLREAYVIESKLKENERPDRPVIFAKEVKSQKGQLGSCVSLRVLGFLNMLCRSQIVS